MIAKPQYHPELGLAGSWYRYQLELERTRSNRLRWSLLVACAERDDALWHLARINGRAQQADHGETTEGQQALRSIAVEASRGLARRGEP